MASWAGVVLAAGLGTRMRSSVTKVLHPVCGKPMVLYPIKALRDAGMDHIVVVVSPGNEEEVHRLLGDSVEYARQAQALGTGHALAQVAPLLQDHADNVVVINADSVFINSGIVRELCELQQTSSTAIALLSTQGCLQKGMGRLVRDDEGRVIRVAEAGDCEGSVEPFEINVGGYCFSGEWLWSNLKRVPLSSRGEFYITSLIASSVEQGKGVEALVSNNPVDAMGINDRIQLAQVQDAMYKRLRDHWMLEGVSMMDPSSIFIDASAILGQDTVIHPNTMILGDSMIGRNCHIGPGSVIKDSRVGDGCTVIASFMEEATLEEEVDIGPFSHLRPGAYLETGVHLGNFGEVKNSRLGRNTAMGHFGYVGDAKIGANVNLGAGLVTCNYDGVSHLETVVEEGAFIGSDTMLVAPVRVGAESITGAGSVVTRDVEPHRLVTGVPARIKKTRNLRGKK